MSDNQAEESGARRSRRRDDLGGFLLKRLALQKQELEVDKLFVAAGELEGSRFALKVAARDGAHQGRAESPSIEARLSRGDVRLLYR